LGKEFFEEDFFWGQGGQFGELSFEFFSFFSCGFFDRVGLGFAFRGLGVLLRRC
jgi:hypothetical protein